MAASTPPPPSLNSINKMDRHIHIYIEFFYRMYRPDTSKESTEKKERDIKIIWS